jgi:hypothetical protein
MAERLLPMLTPDFFSEKEKDTPNMMLEFSILKIVNRAARLGCDMKDLFHSWDTDKNGYRKFKTFYLKFDVVDTDEIIRGA